MIELVEVQEEEDESQTPLWDATVRTSVYIDAVNLYKQLIVAFVQKYGLPPDDATLNEFKMFIKKMFEPELPANKRKKEREAKHV